MRVAVAAVTMLALVGCSGDSSAPLAPSTPSTSRVPAMPPDGGRTVSGPRVVGQLVAGLDAPWSVAPVGEDRALITQRDSAEVLLLDSGSVSAAARVADVVAGGEGGLLGLAMTGPDASRVYVYYTAADDNRVTVFDFDGTRMTNERTVLTGIPKGVIHNGGRIAFGPDGYLYVATGETGQPALAPDRTSLAGKILRIRRDGRPAPDNPDPASPVYSAGHRNVQGLAWDGSGRLWATEFGENDVDELNLIEAGGDYGWPQCEGPCDTPGLKDPAATWSPTSTSSPSGLAVVGGSAWVAALRGRTLYEVPLRGRTADEPRAWLTGEHGRLRDVVAAPDGGLWVMTNNTDGRGDPSRGDDRILQVEVPD